MKRVAMVMLLSATLVVLGRTVSIARHLAPVVADDDDGDEDDGGDEGSGA